VPSFPLSVPVGFSLPIIGCKFVVAAVFNFVQFSLNFVQFSI
jgi:hypothetical protein